MMDQRKTNDSFLGVDLIAKIVAKYEAPARHHHGMGHISFMLALLDEYWSNIYRHREMEAAIWLHDVIYNSKAADNEKQSVAFAVEHLEAKFSSESLFITSAHIMVTEKQAIRI